MLLFLEHTQYIHKDQNENVTIMTKLDSSIVIKRNLIAYKILYIP